MFEDMIKIEEGFQTSVNIAYDLTDEQKIKKFIPTLSSIDIIEDILLSINPSSTQRARILVGAYGRGKSHIILVLLSLLYKKNVELFTTLLEKIKSYNEKLYDYISEYIDSKRKLLPVVISGSSASLTQSFMSALQKTLEIENLQDVMPDTHFKAAINTIENWQRDYLDTYNSFVLHLGEPVADFVLKLKSYDVSSYDKFVSLYPKLTAGSSFNPFVGFDVVEIYEKVNDKLTKKGYDGLFIVYDEFSKYLESSISTASISDIKLLQDFAEKCNRSAYRQMHLLLICHKDISNYIDNNLPKDKVDGWRGVSGRFKHVDLQNNFSQIYEIIASVIKKDDEKWNKYVKKNREAFLDITRRMQSLDIFACKDVESVATIILGCYPLHPISVFILPRISEKIAQNERTLFTFLSATEKNSLPAYLSQNIALDKDYLTADVIYDYFEPLLRKEAYTSDTHKIYKLASTVLRKVDENSIEAKIIKLIALIYIVSQFEKMPPTVNMIVEAFKDNVSDAKEIHDALNKLLQQDCIVYLKRSNNYLKLKESSGVDVPKEIEKKSSFLKTTSTAEEILNDSCLENYIYPTKYNDEHDITRYFDFSFIPAEKILLKYNFDYALRSSQADGIVFAVVPKSEDDLNRVRNYLLDNPIIEDRVLLVMPKSFINISDIAYEYAAVKELKESSHDDDILSDEYSVYIEDLEEVVNNFLNSYLRPEMHKSDYYHMGKLVQLNRKAQLSALLSDICDNAFPYTPIINNESINKNNLPTVAINSRGKILNGILSIPLEKNLGLVGSGQDVSIMRSVLIRTGVLIDAESNPSFNKETKDTNINRVLQTIREFFLETGKKEKMSFDILYQKLTEPSHGIGLKKGVIPIFIAIVIREMRESLTILLGEKELRVTADLLANINEAPSKYFVRIDEWNSEKEDYIKGLVDIFSDYISDKNCSFNNLSFIVSAMSRWYLSLSKYSKEQTEIYCGNSERLFKPISRSKKQFINAIKQVEINPREFLFNTLFKIFGMSDFTLDILDNIRGTKNDFDNALSNLIDVLVVDIKTIFGEKNDKVSLSSTLKNWCDTLNADVFNYLFLNNENKILELFIHSTNDEKQMVQRIAKAITSLRVEDWSSKTITLFLKQLAEFKNTVERHNEKIQSGKTNAANNYKLAFVSSTGEEVVRTFEKIEYSRKANLLKNEIETALEEMGQAISEQEKRQVLIEILEKLC